MTIYSLFIIIYYYYTTYYLSVDFPDVEESFDHYYLTGSDPLLFEGRSYPTGGQCRVSPDWGCDGVNWGKQVLLHPAPFGLSVCLFVRPAPAVEEAPPPGFQQPAASLLLSPALCSAPSLWPR